MGEFCRDGNGSVTGCLNRASAPDGRRAGAGRTTGAHRAAVATAAARAYGAARGDVVGDGGGDGGGTGAGRRNRSSASRFRLLTGMRRPSCSDRTGRRQDTAGRHPRRPAKDSKTTP
ncbi:hypothetical protein GCM10017687_72270 [Streptomyces echinatus]